LSSKPDGAKQPIYGGSTSKGRISMTNGHQLASATRRPDGTIVVRTIPAPLARMRFAVYRCPLLRGLVLPPIQTGETLALLTLERTSAGGHTAEPTAQADSKLADPRALARLARRVAIAWAVRGVRGTQLALSGAAALGARQPLFASVVAAVCFALRPILRWRLARATATDDLAALHGAEHQALNCVRAGVPLTDWE
jgi:uncharacterized protein YqhQ